MKDPDASQTNDAVTELNGGGMSTGIGFATLAAAQRIGSAAGTNDPITFNPDENS
jgi:hypothetical protein